MMRLFKILCLFLVSVFCLTVINISSVFGDDEVNQTSDTGTIQNSTQNSMEAHAFYPAFINYSSDMEKYIDGLDSISFAWSRLYSDNLTKLGTVKGQHDNYGFYYPTDYLKPILYAKSRGKSIQLSIYADATCSRSVLPFADKRSQVIETIMTAMNTDITKGQAVFYDGVVIDFESLRDVDKNGKDILVNGEHISTYFNMFLTDLKAELSKVNKKLYVAVNPRIYFNGYDYREITKIADKMIIMAHDYEPTEKLSKSAIEQYTGYDALNPIDSPSPINKIKLALDDVKNSLENVDDMKKVWLQICFDCKQWRFTAGNSEEWETLDYSTLSKEGNMTIFYNKIKARLENTDGKAQSISSGYNNELQSPYITYFNTPDKTYNVIVYEDSVSIAAKLKMLKAYGLGGISIWCMGNIPDFNDDIGRKYHLDVWDNLISGLKDSSSEVNNTVNDVISFSDTILENAIRNKLGKPEGDIYKSDLEGVYRFKLPGNVTNLSDLKYLTNLEYLDAQSANLNDITYMNSLTNLRVLKLQKNQINDISPIGDLKNLQILNLSENKISDITPLRSLTGLEELYVGNNKVESISSLKSLVGIKTLYLDFNNVSDVSSLSGLKNIYRLSMEGNKVSGLTPLGSLSKLRYLDLAANKISDISQLKTIKKVNFLYLQRNGIKDITSLKYLTGLKELSLNSNLIMSIQPLASLIGMEKLYLRENRITSIYYLKSLNKLNTLYLGGNGIKDFSPVKAYFKNLKSCDFKIK